MTTSPERPGAGGPDWHADLVEIRRRMEHHLRGVDAADVEDCVQLAAVGLLRFTRRVGRPQSVLGLIEVIVRRTADGFFRSQYRRRRRFVVLEELHQIPDGKKCDLEELEQEVAWKALRVIEYFRQRDAPCVELAEARARGEDFRQLASRLRESHDALRQRWSRCVRKLREQLSQGLFAWEQPRSGRPE